jgi:NAD(P)-dependent dehydrogenase (short-subunit alcohol dehydrogenase family)
MSTRALITGATAGIGRETAIALARQGWELVLACRNTAKGEVVAADIAQRTGNKQVAVVACDLSSLKSVRACAATCAQRFTTLDVLLNNAGMASLQRRESEDGYELTLATNHLGPFLLTNLLLPQLQAAGEARVVTVASNSHYRGRIDFADLQNSRNYGGYQAYCDSKLANVLFALALARRLRGTRVTSNAVHPGTVASDIWPRDKPLLQLASAVARPFMAGVAKGAEPLVSLASAPRLASVSGRYYDRLREREPSRQAQDSDLQDALWRVSAELVRL